MLCLPASNHAVTRFVVSAQTPPAGQDGPRPLWGLVLRDAYNEVVDANMEIAAPPVRFTQVPWTARNMYDVAEVPNALWTV